MNNLRLLAGVLCVLLPGVGALCQTRRVVTLEEIYRTAEAGSAKLRTAYASEREADSEIAEKRDARLPDISAEASVGFIDDGFDETNLIDLNWYVFAGIIAGVGFTYLTFALRKWRYKTMTIIGFLLAASYLAWFYFGIGFGVEKEALFVPLFIRGTASVIISIVFLTSIVQSGLPFTVFPQALTINGFTGAVVGAALGPALVGEWFSHVLTRNINATGMIPPEAMVLAMKEIYGWLLIMGLTIILVIAVSYGQLRPFAIFPKWKNIRRTIRRLVRER